MKKQLDCDVIKKILNKNIFGNDKKELFESIAKYPERFIGFFRPTKPYAKILQFLLQSHEIKFGNALEKIIGYIFESQGFEVSLGTVYEDEGLSIDLLISNKTNKYLIEIKVRDDHDSAKKRGQITNFERKIEAFISEENCEHICIMYFIDPTLKKNKNYYKQELSNLKEKYNIEINLFYGDELFEYFGINSIWNDFEDCLKDWKEEIPKIPDIDYDNDVKGSVNVLKGIETKYWKKILERDELWEKDGVINSIFSTGETLVEIYNIFSKEKGYKDIAEKLGERIMQLYNINVK
jgi:hypothetical protein